MPSRDRRLACRANPARRKATFRPEPLSLNVQETALSRFTVYLAAKGFTAELARELGLPESVLDEGLSSSPPTPAELAERGGVLPEAAFIPTPDPMYAPASAASLPPPGSASRQPSGSATGRKYGKASARPSAKAPANPSQDGASLLRQGRLVVSPGEPKPAAWAQNVWQEPFFLEATSIGEAARALKAIQRNWTLYPTRLHRRARLIEEKLPPVSAKPIEFGAVPPASPLGSWTLLDQNLILASARCASPFAHGEPQFVENKEIPPNRAYLKLWEAFTLLGARPAPGELCLDLGSSPGGWTWVLQSLGARVVSVDKADLDPKIARLPNIEFLRESAFGLDPKQVLERWGVVDWLFSDVICYPERLWGLVERWLESGACRNLVCTIKFQADTDFEAQRRFASVPGSRLLHLYNNKHELTWALLR